MRVSWVRVGVVRYKEKAGEVDESRIGDGEGVLGSSSLGGAIKEVIL